jgi:hypothetical protein
LWRYRPGRSQSAIHDNLRERPRPVKSAGLPYRLGRWWRGTCTPVLDVPSGRACGQLARALLRVRPPLTIMTACRTPVPAA